MDAHRLVTSVAQRASSGRAHDVERLPDGRALVLLRLGAATDLSLSGPLTRAVYKRVPGTSSTVAVKLAPGAASRLVGDILDELADRTVPLDALWGRSAEQLLERAVERPGDATQLVLEAIDVRLRRSGDDPPAVTLTRMALERIEADPTGLTVASLAQTLGVTARHLHRTFTPQVGVAPKRYLRMRRLRTALERAAARTSSWSDVALDAGYVDQAHLIRDCSALYGMPPGSFVRRRERQRARTRCE